VKAIEAFVVQELVVVAVKVGLAATPVPLKTIRLIPLGTLVPILAAPLQYGTTVVIAEKVVVKSVPKPKLICNASAVPTLALPLDVIYPCKLRIAEAPGGTVGKTIEPNILTVCDADVKLEDVTAELEGFTMIFC
jgi:hypothetical protein